MTHLSQSVTMFLVMVTASGSPPCQHIVCCVSGSGCSVTEPMLARRLGLRDAGPRLITLLMTIIESHHHQVWVSGTMLMREMKYRLAVKTNTTPVKKYYLKFSIYLNIYLLWRTQETLIDITTNPGTHNRHESVLPLFAESRALSRSGALHNVSWWLRYHPPEKRLQKEISLAQTWSKTSETWKNWNIVHKS